MDKKYTKITFVGDFQCFRKQNDAILSKYGEYYYWDTMAPCKRLFEDSDYVVGNLETPVANAGTTDAAIQFNTPLPFLDSIKSLGVDFLQTCNNHCLDRGEEGLDQTIDNLDKYGFEHSGTYKAEKDSERVFVKEINGIKFAIICCTYGTNSKYNGVLLPTEKLWKVDLLKKQDKQTRFMWKPEYGPMIVTFEPDNVNKAAITNSANIPYLERIKRKIELANEIADIVIVIPHIGGQYNPAPGSYTKYIMNWLTLVGGVDLVIAGHPHVPLRCETINDVFCTYSLGNFHSSPGHEHYLTNVFAEYGIVLYTYWNNETKLFEKVSFSIVKNVVGEDGVATTYPLYDWYHSRESRIDKEMLEIENEAVVNRVLGTAKGIDIKDEYSFQD